MRIFSLALAMLVTGCEAAPRTSGDALCDATRAPRAAHSAALADEGSDRMVVRGQALIATMDAGCDRSSPRIRL